MPDQPIVAKVVREGVDTLQAPIEVRNLNGRQLVWVCPSCGNTQPVGTIKWYPKKLCCKGCLREWVQYHPVKMRVVIGNGIPYYEALANPGRLSLLLRT